MRRGLSIVIHERQTPACCVGDSLKECQRKHSQTTCSPRAEGLASLQAHLHTIPQLLASQSQGDRAGAKGREESRVPRQGEPASSVTVVSVMKVMTSERNNKKQHAEGGSQES